MRRIIRKLAQEAQRELDTDVRDNTRFFQGTDKYAAEYVYFKALRDFRIGGDDGDICMIVEEMKRQREKRAGKGRAK